MERIEIKHGPALVSCKLLPFAASQGYPSLTIIIMIYLESFHACLLDIRYIFMFTSVCFRTAFVLGKSLGLRYKKRLETIYKDRDPSKAGAFREDTNGT